MLSQLILITYANFLVTIKYDSYFFHVYQSGNKEIVTRVCH